tara:strand:+ start:1095 stop:2576 length:1482 start_codon:yes stop_codon:yes gene_type:complete
VKLTRKELRYLILEQIESERSPAADYFDYEDEESFAWPLGDVLSDMIESVDSGDSESAHYFEDAFDDVIEIIEDYMSEDEDSIEDPEGFLAAMQEWADEYGYEVPQEFINMIESQIEYLDEEDKKSEAFWAAAQAQGAGEEIILNPCDPEDIRKALEGSHDPRTIAGGAQEYLAALARIEMQGENVLAAEYFEHPDALKLALGISGDRFTQGDQVNLQALAQSGIFLENWEEWAEDENGMMHAATLFDAIGDGSIPLDYERVHDAITIRLFGDQFSSVASCVASAVESMEADSPSVEEPRDTLFESEYGFYEDIFVRKDGEAAVIRHVMPDSTSSIDVTYRLNQEVGGQEIFNDTLAGIESTIEYNYGDLVAVHENAAVIYNDTLGLIIIDRDGFRFSEVDRNGIDDDGDTYIDNEDPDYDTGLLDDSSTADEYDRTAVRDRLRDFIEMPQEEFDSLSDEDFDELLTLIASDSIDNDGDGVIDELDPDGDTGL